ncbi:DUF1289 domain-containing protein [Burkholderia oklahomensis]|uniref:DUF1289 domain-containing protein n=1 Tax=Burkholderia oklahomensis TaxID=342113 RepID=UPI00016A783D|nr:DUF1289 domain-containing protein [Burkholderia oklahomensis]AJX31282.1 hypothetical protein BG90_1266 [Burkholderia oklahomensis C6786]AOI47355.1 hypothetical protein WI23_17125 [Burkholderia oklahomensis C6786]KUY61876.1 hypothetical protein WI23_11980 [Burkholderia oklahomensis C6786]MDN7674227.1 DUF1289 domain-containing protein [Burkholderia oklahomensis]SUW59316.1 Predicted Fe-S protein [Burkholderia oklahomensis]
MSGITETGGAAKVDGAPGAAAADTAATDAATRAAASETAVNAVAAGEATAASATNVPSPCTNVCRIDAKTGWCEGCRRTRDEIAGWRKFDDDAKRAVLARLAARRTACA